MLDPRIYRTGLVAVALAVIVFAFSLGDQQGAASTNIPPESFNGQNAYANMVGLARKYPNRRPGSFGDDALAGDLATALRKDGFMVSTSVHTGRTADGKRALETVTGSRTGLAGGSIVIVTHRDSLGSPSVADLSGTAVLLELARVLAGETQHRSIVLASTSGSAGAAGPTELARNLGGPVDAVIALGDLAGSRLRHPVLVPWSDGEALAPPLLRNTIASTLSAQSGIRPGGTSLAGQLAHLAFPLSTSEQGPFGARGYPAVLLSLSGEEAPAADERIAGATRITDLGRAVLQGINALDSGPSVPAPSAYMLYSGKVVPGWAIRLLIGALILPVLMATIDGLARARRRGHPIARWLLWVVAAALPFVLALAVIRGAELAGVVSAPPGPAPAGTVPLGSGGVAVLVVVALAIVGSFFAWRPLARALSGGARLGSPANGGAAAAVLLVTCATVILIWARNPFAAALIAPGLHLWLWTLDLDLRIPRLVKLLMVALGALPVVLVVVYYALSLGLGPVQLAWTAVLLLAGGHVGLVAAVEWSVLLGCFASIVWIVVRTPRIHHHEEQVPVTVRGPISYAGPGSLGGTESALRR
jgi:hypothetical protein